MLKVKDEFKTEQVQEVTETYQSTGTEPPQIETKYLETFKPSPAKKSVKRTAKKQTSSPDIAFKKIKLKHQTDECSKPPSSKKRKKLEEDVPEKANEESKTAVASDHEEVKEADNYHLMNNRTDSRFETISHNDLVGVILEEISLEGLDGITIEALWTRVADAIAETVPLKKHVEKSIWNIARSLDKIRFYELPEARSALVVFNRFKYFDWESGHIIEPDEYPIDIYPFSPITDKHLINMPCTITNTILGSCSTFGTRKEVTMIARNLSLEEAETQFGSRLVMVADQVLRARVLTSENADPTIKLTNVQYCILERIGRSRRLGEVTAGQNSLMNFGDSKTLFYLRKQLMKHDFITKQPFCIRNKASGNSVGLLFHLKKFYTEHKSKKQVLIEQVVDMLKKKPKYRMEYAELKETVGLDTWNKGGIRKLIKTQEFKQFVQTDVIVPYRTMYPNASPKEWKHKCSPKEKGLRVLQLINPSVNVSANCRDEDQKDDSSDDERIGDYPFNVSIFNHTYNLIFEAGSDGLSSKQVQKKLGLEFYLTRSILNNMIKRNMVDTANVDIGRQHIIKYYARCFNNPEFRAKYNEKKENDEAEKSTEKSCDDDDVLSFIAEVLNVDKDCLKTPKNDAKSEEQPERNPFEGHYDFIKNFRKNNRLEKFNACEKNRYKAENLNQLALKDDAEIPAPPTPTTSTDKHGKDNYDGILKNFQLHYPMELSMKEKRIEQLKHRFSEPSFSFTLPCGNVINDINKEVKSINFTSQYEMVKGKCQMQNLNVLKSALVAPKRKEPGLLGCSESVYSVLQYYFFLNLEKEYNVILTTFANLMNDIHCEVKKKLVFPSEFDSDDEHYAEGENCDNWSIGVNAGDSCKSIEDSITGTNSEDADFKRMLMADFENPNFSFRKDNLNDGILYHCTSKGVKRSLSFDEKSAKKSRTADTEATAISKTTESTVKMNMFMGVSPVISSETVDEDGIETIIVISTPPEKYAEFGTKYTNKQLSERSLARANFIIETVYREKMISDLSKLTAMLKMVERKSNCSGTIDKKTLDRLLHKLVSEGYVKMIKIILKYDNVTRVKNMICLPSVDVNAAVQLTIEQMKMSFFIYAKRKTTQNVKPTEEKEDEAEYNDCNESLNEMDAFFMSTNKTNKFKYSRIAGKHYGYVPKFAKFKMLHELVFYLVYGYDGEEVTREDVPKLLKQLNVKLDGVNPTELSPIYKRELSWKMFVPPLPEHKSFSEGWTLVCDIILRLPLSAFVKIYNISYIIPELMPFLNHPLKRHFLLKNIPPNIRNGFLNSRKYIFSIHEILCNLCYLGLLQFGAQKLRDKDQQFVYLNRNAVLYDTTPSEPGYHQISQKEYEKLSFHFQTEVDVEEYWSKLWSISMSTKLGQRYSQLDKTITLQDIHGKTAMIEAMRPKTIQMAAEADVGYVPGDHLGACCLDSSTWVHVKRNWVWASHAKKSRNVELPHATAVGIRKKHLEQVKLKPIKYRDLQKEINKKKSMKREVNLSHSDSKKVTVKKKIGSKRKMPRFRKVLPRPPPFRKRILTTDELDKKLISKMGKSRSIWSEEEDIALVLCKTSAIFLCPCKSQSVPHTAIRDVMHRLFPNKRKKPSTAYTRRYMKVIKSEDLEGKHKFFYNLDNDRVVQKYFAKFCKKLKGDNMATDEQVCVAFVYLASYAIDHYKLNLNSYQKKLQESGCIDYLTPEDIHKFDRLLCSKDSDDLYHEPFNEDDIKMDVIKSVIHCSLGWKSDSSDLPLMLYRIYQNFPDYLLRAAITCMREQQIISGKKTLSKHVNVKEVVSVAGSHVHSSFTYSFKQITKYPDYIFPEANEFFTGVHKYKNSDALIMKNFEQGHGLGLSEIAATYKITLDFKVPNEFLVLDPAIADHSELFRELATRYKLTLTKRNAEENAEESDQESNEQLQKTIEQIFEAWSAKSKDGGREISEAKQTPDESQMMHNTTDLAYLLTKGLFPERDDEEQLEKLQKHFLLMFPSSSFKFEGLQEDDAWYQDVLTRSELLSERLFKTIETDCIVKNEPSEDQNITEVLGNLSANFVDLETSRNVVAFIHAKGMFGATSRELKDKFDNENGDLDLFKIISVLLKENVIIRTGITCLRFVHFSYNNMWTIHLDEQRTISEGDGRVLGVGMKLMPWIQINGTVNVKILQNWLSIILSHCMSFPFVTFNALTKRFNFLKPVDIYYLTEYLQELRCIQLYTYVEKVKVTLFSSFSHVDKRKATFLDDFESVFIEVDTLAATRFGAFWNRGKTDIKTPFDG